MTTFNKYHLNPDSYDFLSIFKEKWLEIRDEYTAYLQDVRFQESRIRKILTPQSTKIMSKKGHDFEAVGFRFHGKSFLQVIAHNKLTWPEVETNEALETVESLMQTHFKTTQECISKANKQTNHLIRNVYISVLKPGLEVKCHINYNPHIYRAYLGLQVPKGDVAMRICDETLHWKEGEILVLDHTYPHCPHNLTNKPRVVLIIDFYQPDKPLQSMIELEQKLIIERMQTNPHSLGVFGDEDYVSDAILEKYGFQDQADWDKLSTKIKG
jgi:aspartyl/asparaginyl beta-hydroxylase (cupin superfamily)